MKKKINIYNKNEIDLVVIIKLALKEIKLVLFLLSIFGFLGYLYSKTIPDKYTINVELRPPSFLEFSNYYNFNDDKYNDEIYIDFSEFFKSNIVSINNIKAFLENLEDAKPLILSLQKKDISIEEYLFENFFQDKQNPRLGKDNSFLNIKFNYYTEINAHKILNEYVIYIAKSTSDQFSKKLETIILNDLKSIKKKKILKKFELENKYKQEISKYESDLISFKKEKTRYLNSQLYIYEKALRVARALNIEEPLPLALLEDNNNASTSIIFQPNTLFYRGTKALSVEIENLKNDFDNFNQDQEYNDILNLLDRSKFALINIKTDPDYMNLIVEEEDYNLRLLNFNNSEFNWDPFLQKALKPNKPNNSSNKSFYIIVGLLIGLFISFVIIYIKNNSK